MTKSELMEYINTYFKTIGDLSDNPRADYLRFKELKLKREELSAFDSEKLASAMRDIETVLFNIRNN